MTDTIKIEIGVPRPAKPGKGNCKYPVASMAVGDSFFFPAAPRGDAHLAQCRIAACASAFSRSVAGKGTKFQTAQVEGGVRCWRIA